MLPFSPLVWLIHGHCPKVLPLSSYIHWLGHLKRLISPAPEWQLLIPRFRVRALFLFLMYPIEWLVSVECRGQRATCIGRKHLGDLSEVDLVVGLSVANTILVSIWTFRFISSACQTINVAIISHLKIDTNTAIKGLPRQKNIKIRNSSFYNLRQDFVGFLVMAHPDFDSVTRVQQTSNCSWQD